MSSKSSISRAIFMLLFLLCTSVLSVSAAVSLTKKILNSLNMAAYIGAQHYSQPITSQLMISEAKSALSLLPGGKKTKPSVVSALWAGGDKIFYASSAKGKGTVPGNEDDKLDIATPVLGALEKCAADFDRHNYDGKCGEIMVISQWLQENPGKSLPKDKIIVAVNDRGVVPPCPVNEGKNTYGCARFLHEMKFDGSEIIDKEPKAEACELSPPGSPKGSLGKKACRRPSKGTKPTKSTKAPKKGKVSKPKGAKPAPRRKAARPVSRRPKHRRSVQPR